MLKSLLTRLDSHSFQCINVAHVAASKLSTFATNQLSGRYILPRPNYRHNETFENESVKIKPFNKTVPLYTLILCLPTINNNFIFLFFELSL